jgi:hypothetical protein
MIALVTASNPPREHHLLPRWYLRGFADFSSRVLIAKAGAPRKLTPVSRATVVRDYYAMTRADGSLDWTLEEAIGPSESIAAKLSRTMLAGGFPLCPEDRLEFAGFLALQTVRGEMFRAAWEGVAREAGVRPSRNATIRQMLDHLPQLVNVLLRMRWRLRRSDTPILFTGDQPVVYWRRGRSPRFFDGIGPMTAEEVRFVLDPQHMLVLSWTGSSQDERCSRLGGQEAASLNAFAARWCERELYCRPDLGRYLPAVYPQPLPSTASPHEAAALLTRLARLGNWQEASCVASSRGWGDPAEGYGFRRGRRLRL